MVGFYCFFYIELFSRRVPFVQTHVNICIAAINLITHFFARNGI